MSKTTITRLFIGSGIAIVAGAILALAGVWLAIANDAFVMNGPDMVGLRGGALAWTGLGLGLVGIAAVVAGFIGALVSWIGALTNTWQLDSKTWFAVLLLLGVFNLGFFAMVAYLFAGPDGTGDPNPPFPVGDGRGMTSPMAGKAVLVTGGTGGIGRAAAVALAAMGARVGIVGRERTRAQAAATAIVRETGNPAIDPFIADLSSQADIRRVADEVLATYPRIDVLINNVGGFWAHRHATADGLERTFALNHLAPFLLTNLLLDRLVTSGQARVVTVSSHAQAMGSIDFDDLMGERSYSGQRAYNASKLANVLFTYELARRLVGTSVTTNVLHPGVTNTSFSAEDPARAFAPLVAIMRPFMRSPERGADTAIYLASADQVDGVTGRYWVDRKARTSSASSYDIATAARLWEVSADLVGLALS